jgi:hypothetical protein
MPEFQVFFLKKRGSPPPALRPLCPSFKKSFMS